MHRDGVLTPEQAAEAAAGTLEPRDVTDMNPSWGWAAGAGISTTDDRVTAATLSQAVIDDAVPQLIAARAAVRA